MRVIGVASVATVVLGLSASLIRAQDPVAPCCAAVGFQTFDARDVAIQLVSVHRNGPDDVTVTWQIRNGGETARQFAKMAGLAAYQLVWDAEITDSASRTRYKVASDAKTRIPVAAKHDPPRASQGVLLPAGKTLTTWARFRVPATVKNVAVALPGAARPWENVTIVPPASSSPAAAVTALNTPLKDLRVSPPEFPGGTPAFGTVELVAAPPAGGLTVTLQVKGPTGPAYPDPPISVPPQVVVTQGAASAETGPVYTARFPITATPTRNKRPATIVARVGAQTLETTLTVLPPRVVSATADVPNVCKDATADVEFDLDAPAPAGNVTANVSIQLLGFAEQNAHKTVDVGAGATTGRIKVPVGTCTHPTSSSGRCSFQGELNFYPMGSDSGVGYTNYPISASCAPPN
jgi:hypothetical protein